MRSSASIARTVREAGLVGGLRGASRCEVSPESVRGNDRAIRPRGAADAVRSQWGRMWSRQGSLRKASQISDLAGFREGRRDWGARSHVRKTAEFLESRYTVPARAVTPALPWSGFDARKPTGGIPHRRDRILRSAVPGSVRIGWPPSLEGWLNLLSPGRRAPVCTRSRRAARSADRWKGTPGGAGGTAPAWHPSSLRRRWGYPRGRLFGGEPIGRGAVHEGASCSAFYRGSLSSQRPRAGCTAGDRGRNPHSRIERSRHGASRREFSPALRQHTRLAHRMGSPVAGAAEARPSARVSARLAPICLGTGQDPARRRRPCSCDTCLRRSSRV